MGACCSCDINILFSTHMELPRKLLLLMDDTQSKSAQLVGALFALPCNCSEPHSDPDHILRFHWAPIWAEPLLKVLTQAKPMGAPFFTTTLPKLLDLYPGALTFLLEKLVPDIQSEASLLPHTTMRSLIALLRSGRALGVVCH